MEQSTNRADESAPIHVDLAERPLGEVIGSIASELIAPGAGAAGAVALALAAACAEKAAAITLKRADERQHVDPGLRGARDRLADIRGRALRGAEVDASRFEDFVRAHDAESAERLVDSGEWLKRLAAELDRVLGELEGRVDRVVASDITAAQALRNAFAAIQRTNLDENRRAADALK